MHAPEVVIERLTLPVQDADVAALAEVLRDAVLSGAAVSFLATLTQADAEAWWRRTLAAAHPKAVFLAARQEGRIVGTVQLHPAWAPNQPHRMDLAKLAVHRDCRRGGIGQRLMEAAEAAAREAGCRLLTLDAKRGGAAERLYRRLGWTYVGMIPNFAVDPDGVTYHDDVIFYKELGPPATAVDRTR